MLASGTFVIYGKPVICHSIGFKRKGFFLTLALNDNI